MCTPIDPEDSFIPPNLGFCVKLSSNNDTQVDNMKERKSHMRGIIREQFALEVRYKEEELNNIEERIHLAKMMLQRLRLGVLAQHYGAAAFYPTALDYRDETIGEQDTWEVFEKELMWRPGTGCHEESSKEVENMTQEDKNLQKDRDPIERDNPVIRTSDELENVPMETTPPPHLSLEWPQDKEEEMRDIDETRLSEEDQIGMSEEEGVVQESEGRGMVQSYKKRVVIGNTSQYLSPTGQQLASSDDNVSTHKWMVYVRGPQTEPDISSFVKAVRFFLHPSYHPNDIVRVRNPPFHLTRLGWGEFPVRVQLEFHSKCNKSVDIIHTLVLDRTHTGQQTLGAETVVDLDLMMPPDGRPPRLNGLSTYQTIKKEPEVNHSDSAQYPSHPSSDAGSPLREWTKPPLSPDPSSTWMENDDSSSSSRILDQPSSSSFCFSGGGNVLTTNLDKYLHNAVRGIPICGKAAQFEDFYISAPSLAQYRVWHIGRRRATEWERAVTLRKTVEKKLRVSSLLSTKKVMEWCRQNGYTPLDPVPANGRGFCKVCGCQLEAMDDSYEEEEEEEEDGGGGGGGDPMLGSRKCIEVHEHCQTMMFGKGFSLRGNLLDPFDELRPDAVDRDDESSPPLPKLCSLSPPQEMVAKMLAMQDHLEDQEKKTDEDIDVYSLPSSPSCARSRVLGDMVPRFRVPQTPELKWVQQTSSSIGIHIYPAVIDRMYAHVIEHMIYISCARFLRGILGQAVQGAGQGVEGPLSKDRILTPFHLQQAILRLEHCDFLTNRYLGIKPHPCPLADPEGKVTIANSASTCVTSSSSECSSDEEEVGL